MDTYEVYALKYGASTGTRGRFFHGTAADPHDAPVDLAYYVWLLRNRYIDIVVDTGFSAETAARRGRLLERSPIDALASMGVDVGRVPYVILSHFHYDHAGNIASFANARVVVQEREMNFWTGRHLARQEFRHWVELGDLTELVGVNYAGRMMFATGAHEIAPGVTVHLVGGHTAGMQIVRVNTMVGAVVLAVDASHFYANFENDTPFAIVHDLSAMYSAFDTMKRLAVSPAYVVPGHDPMVMTRFPAVEGEEGRCVRIA